MSLGAMFAVKRPWGRMIHHLEGGGVPPFHIFLSNLYLNCGNAEEKKSFMYKNSTISLVHLFNTFDIKRIWRVWGRCCSFEILDTAPLSKSLAPPLDAILGWSSNIIHQKMISIMKYDHNDITRFFLLSSTYFPSIRHFMAVMMAVIMLRMVDCYQTT